ncbi:hypothetical protein ES703_39626 [subsurface metagenome]
MLTTIALSISQIIIDNFEVSDILESQIHPFLSQSLPQGFWISRVGWIS